jgi:hypothetical protein
MERNEGGEVVRRRIERKEGTTSLPPSSGILLTTALLPSSQSSSLLLSLIPIHPPHYLSPSFLPVILDEEVVKQVLKRRFEERG